jgi:hypothetical protein
MPALELAAEAVDDTVGVGEEADDVGQIDHGSIVQAGVAQGGEIALSHGLRSECQLGGILADDAFAAESEELPVFQSEMQADGMDTALLIHRAITEANAAMYLQNDFIVSESSLEGNPHGLIQLTADGFETQGPYHAIAHYALRTDPGWGRVQADTNTADLRVSAWQDPTGDALTIVLVNPGAAAVPVDLYLDELRRRLTSSEVTLTVFSENEELSAQGELSASNTLNVPADALVTVALWE